MEKISFTLTIVKNTNTQDITFEFNDKERAKAELKKILQGGVHEYDAPSGTYTIHLPSQIVKVSTTCADLFAD